MMSTQQVGRLDEFGALISELDATIAGASRVAVIVGEAGIGKTTLVERLLAEAEKRGCLTLRANADEVLRGKPFGPILELVDESGLWQSNLIERAVSDNDGEGSSDQQHRAVDAVVEALQLAAQAQPVVLSIDNVQWADAATLRALPLIAKGVRDHRVLMVQARRPAPPVPETHRVLTGSSTIEICEIRLSSLANHDVDELVRRHCAWPPGPRLQQLLASCSGNPFLVLETLKAAEDNGHLVVVDNSIEVSDEGLTISKGFALGGLAGLPDATRLQLELCSILGRGARLEDIAALGEISTMTAWQHLGPAVESGFLDADDSYVTFRHDLIREAVYERIPAALRVALHRSAAMTMTHWGAPPEAVAPHYEVCARAGDALAVEALVSAAERVRHVSPDSSVQWLETAERVTSDDPARRFSIASGLAEAYLFSGRVADAEAKARAMLAEAVAEPHRTRLQVILASTLFLDGRAAEAGEIFVRVFNSPTDSGVDRGVAGVDGAVAFLLSSQLDRAMELLDQVLEAQAGLAAVAYAQAVKGLVLGLRGQLPEGIVTARGGVATADGGQDTRAHRNLPHFFLAQLQVWADRHEDARTNVAAGRRIAGELGLGWHEPIYHMVLAESFLRTGDLDQAAASAEAGLDYALDFNAHLEDARLYSLLAELSLLTGDLGAATSYLHRCDEAQRASGGHGADHFLRTSALVARAEGRTNDSLESLDLLWSAVDMLGVGLRMWEIAPEYVRELLAARRGDDASSVLGRLGELRPILRPLALEWCQALVASDLQRLQEVEVKMVADGRCPQDLAMIRLDAASLAARAGLSDKAEGLRCQARPFVADLEDPVDSVPRITWRDLLTPAEVRVVSLLAEGLTNAEIALQLGLSRRTVESHLHHVYPKLQVQSRVELTVRVSRE